eukprot:644457-Pelagomonas_calceolata.AAC.1
MYAQTSADWPAWMHGRQVGLHYACMHGMYAQTSADWPAWMHEHQVGLHRACMHAQTAAGWSNWHHAHKEWQPLPRNMSSEDWALRVRSQAALHFSLGSEAKRSCAVWFFSWCGCALIRQQHAQTV